MSPQPPPSPPSPPSPEGERLRIGLVGAGPWARRAQAPALVRNDQVELVGIWSRRPDTAAELAGPSGTVAVASFDELVELSDALVFAVPPGVQADLGVRAAHAGRPLLLEKPLAADAAGARRLTEAVAASGVVTLLGLVLRFAPEVDAFLDQARRLRPFGGYAVWLSGAHTLATERAPWRVAGGSLLDLGPHVLDLLEAALGPIEEIRAHGSATGWTGLLATHAGGAVSETSLCVPLPGAAGERRIRVAGQAGGAELDLSTLTPNAWDRLLAAFVAAVRTGEPHPFDAAHGLHLQDLIDTARAQLDLDVTTPPNR